MADDLVPFVITVIVGGPAGGLLPHGTYHLVYVFIVAVAVAVLWRWRSASISTTVAKLILVTVGVPGLAVIGHLGEWARPSMAGRTSRRTPNSSRGNEGVHSFFANITCRRWCSRSCC